MSSVSYDIEKSCPVCSNVKFDKLIDFGRIPHSGVFLSSPEEIFQEINLAFEYCLTCFLIRSRPFCQSNPDYRKVNRPTQNQMPKYTHEIMAYLYQISKNKHGLIMDIGGNDGAFMDLIAKAGYQNRLIIEPSVSLVDICREKDHPVENVYFNSFEAKRIHRQYGAAKVIFCRHVLEHVPDPEDFFHALRIMTDEDGWIFLETPDALGITQGLLGHELWDEHLFHYSLNHLSMMAELVGYDIQWKAIRPHRGGANLLLWAKLGKVKKTLTFKPAGNNLELCCSFKDRWLIFSQKLLHEAQNWPRPIACLGASHPQSNYAIFTGIGKQINFFVDDDPDKMNTFVPLPQPVPVISTDQLLNGDSIGTLLLTAFGCEEWIEKIRRPLSKKGTLLIDPYSLSETV